MDLPSIGSAGDKSPGLRKGDGKLEVAERD
jgi:hypothetical protein